jgi:KaiC/GvpD/RAD55 family RecA-like ATPase
VLHEIFSYFVARDDGVDGKRLGYLSWFVAQFPASEFRNEEAVFYDFLSYCVRLSVPLKQKYFEIYMTTELKKFLVSSKVKITGTEQLSYEEPNSLETAVATTQDVMMAHYREVAGAENAIEDFPVDADKFMKERYDARTVELLGRTFDIASQTSDAGKAAEWIRERLTELADIYDDSAIEEITDDALSVQPMELLVDTGLPAIDKDMVALCRTQLLDISAGPGAGKTRFALGVFAHRAALKGLNVLYYTLEQSKAEAEAMLTARHVLHMFNDIINDKMIVTGSVPNELLPKVEAARLDLFESNKYGKLAIHEADLYLEDFIEKIKTQDRVNGPYDIVIIDHMSLLQSKPAKYERTLDDYKIVAKGYRRFKRYVRKSRKGGISVNQFNREGVAAAKADKEIDATMGAGGMEAYRSTDINIVITFTETMAAQGLRKVSMPKSRSSAGFGSIMLTTRLGCCYFAQLPKKQI